LPNILGIVDQDVKNTFGDPGRDRISPKDHPKDLPRLTPRNISDKLKEDTHKWLNESNGKAPLAERVKNGVKNTAKKAKRKAKGVKKKVTRVVTPRDKKPPISSTVAAETSPRNHYYESESSSDYSSNSEDEIEQAIQQEPLKENSEQGRFSNLFKRSHKDSLSLSDSEKEKAKEVNKDKKKKKRARFPSRHTVLDWMKSEKNTTTSTHHSVPPITGIEKAFPVSQPAMPSAGSTPRPAPEVSTVTLNRTGS
jgi:hypothetical protein